MKWTPTITCSVLSVLVAATTLPAEASAQKRGSISSTQSQGPKAGGSTYKPNKSHAIVPRRVVRNKPQRKHRVNVSRDQMRRSAELATRRSAASSLLSRATSPLEPKVDTSRMSMDVNASGGQVRSKPIIPPPPSTAPPPLPPSRDRRPVSNRSTTIDVPRQPMPSTMRQAQANAAEVVREVRPMKVKVVGMRVPQAAKQRGILLTRERIKAHGRAGLTFNGKDEFKSVGGRITEASNGRGAGFVAGLIDAVKRPFKNLAALITRNPKR